MGVRILIGDCRVRLREFPDNFFQTCVTSPPFWGLRDYGIPPTVWGGDPNCEHLWQSHSHTPQRHGDDGTGGNLEGGRAHQPHSRIGTVKSAFCQHCGGWWGNLGLEPTPDLYVQDLVEVFREVKRVLRDDGTLWLDLGDSYAGSWGNRGHRPELDGTPSYQREKRTRYFSRGGWDDRRDRPPASYKLPGLKPKDLVGIPWRVALALQADGWWLRQAIPWIKANTWAKNVSCESAV